MFANRYNGKPAPGDVVVLELDKIWCYFKNPTDAGSGKLCVGPQVVFWIRNAAVVIMSPSAAFVEKDGYELFGLSEHYCFRSY